MTWLVETLRQHPEVARFLTLALGYALTRLRLGPVRLSAVVAVLIAGAGAGLLAGGMNASAAIGTAGDAIARLPAEPAARQATMLYQVRPIR